MHTNTCSQICLPNSHTIEHEDGDLVKMFHVEFMRKHERENVRDFMRRVANFHMDMRSCEIAEFTL